MSFGKSYTKIYFASTNAYKTSSWSTSPTNFSKSSATSYNYLNPFKFYTDYPRSYKND